MANHRSRQSIRPALCSVVSAAFRRLLESHRSAAADQCESLASGGQTRRCGGGGLFQGRVGMAEGCLISLRYQVQLLMYEAHVPRKNHAPASISGVIISDFKRDTAGGG